MSRIDEIQKELEEFKERQKNKEEAMQEAARKAEEARKLAEKEAQRATEAYCKAEEARKLAEKDLDAVVFYKMRETIKHLVETNKKVYVESVVIYNHWAKKQEG